MQIFLTGLMEAIQRNTCEFSVEVKEIYSIALLLIDGIIIDSILMFLHCYQNLKCFLNSAELWNTHMEAKSFLRKLTRT